jgi:hypothetical protein
MKAQLRRNLTKAEDCAPFRRQDAMQWAVLGIVLFGLFLTYIIFQETRAHHYWRGLVAKGDLNAIRMLLDQEIERWHTMRVPKGVPASVWHGIQTTELVAVGAEGAQVTCAADGEYRFSAGKPQEVTTPIDAAMRLAAKVAEMILYDVPNLHISEVRVDVYSTFHTPDGATEQRCILSVVADRGTADEIDWESLRPGEIVNRFESRYYVNERGIAEPFDPGDPLEGTVLVTEREPTAGAVASELD